MGWSEEGASCGACHQSSKASAKPAAVSVFDLDRTDWYATISDRQLQAFRQRGAKMDPDVVSAFLDAERARRDSERPGEH